MKTEQLTREEINQYMDYCPELETLFSDIINLKNNPSFRECLKFAGITKEESNKIDSAYPVDYARSIREIYPDFDNGLNCYDYNGDAQTFGRMRNVKNDIANRIIKRLSRHAQTAPGC